MVPGVGGRGEEVVENGTDPKAPTCRAAPAGERRDWYSDGAPTAFTFQ